LVGFVVAGGFQITTLLVIFYHEDTKRAREILIPICLKDSSFTKDCRVVLRRRYLKQVKKERFCKVLKKEDYVSLKTKKKKDFLFKKEVSRHQ